jgi:8-oxo-dGTP diphosphatase
MTMPNWRTNWGPMVCTCHQPALANCDERPAFDWVGASCHTAEEISRAGELGLDYALLGPVLATPTHPENPGLGWTEFATRCAGNTLPVFALGGMRETLHDTAAEHGAHGMALMRGWQEKN